MLSEGDRVRSRTAHAVLRRIDEETITSLTELADEGPDAVTRRLQHLDAEWDTDRVIEAEASATGLVAVTAAAVLGRAYTVLPAAVAGAVLLHALTGWYPMLPLFRRLGVRSAREIARERYALKALRGDFSGLEATDLAPAALLRPDPGPANRSVGDVPVPQEGGLK